MGSNEALTGVRIYATRGYLCEALFYVVEIETVRRCLLNRNSFYCRINPSMSCEDWTAIEWLRLIESQRVSSRLIVLLIRRLYRDPFLHPHTVLQTAHYLPPFGLYGRLPCAG